MSIMSNSPPAQLLDKFTELRRRIIEKIIDMKNGNCDTTPQPDYARYALAQYHASMPWLDLNQGVREALAK